MPRHSQLGSSPLTWQGKVPPSLKLLGRPPKPRPNYEFSTYRQFNLIRVAKYRVVSKNTRNIAE